MSAARKRNPKPSHSVVANGVKKSVRVPRACDNCRLRKSKCDGVLPCSFCTLHDSECSYDNSRPKKQLDTKYIVSLERTIDRLKAIIGVPPEVEVTDELLDSYEINQTHTLDAPRPFQLTAKQHAATQTASGPDSPPDPIERTLLESMVEATGRLNIDESGNCDYSGHRAGLTLVQKIRERCDYLLDQKPGRRPRAPHRSNSQRIAPVPRTPSQSKLSPRKPSPLPAWDVTDRYVKIVFEEAFPLFNFIHRPSFDSRLHVFYAARSAGLDSNVEDSRFEVLLNSLFALGELFGGGAYTAQDGLNFRAARAERYFQDAQQSLDPMDCRDITSLQALLCMIIYLQCSGQLPSCYSHISVAMTACIRMGLHRADSLLKFNPIDREVRKRIFWSLKAMDSYITTILDLPRTISDDETDQMFPLEVDDDLLTPHKIKVAPKQGICPMSTVNAHTRLSLILAKVKKTVTGGSEGDPKPSNGRYQVDYAKIVEAEQELADWTTKLPDYTRNQEQVSNGVERAQLLLRVAHGHVQMVLYRPFLHHIARRSTDPNFDFRAFACASACIKAAMQVIWLVEALEDSNLSNGPSWFLFFTLFVAVVGSIMFVITNRDDPTSQEYHMAARRGFTILQKFSGTNQMARNYTDSLKPLFSEAGSDLGSGMQISPPNGINKTPSGGEPTASRIPSSAGLLRSPPHSMTPSPGTGLLRGNTLNDLYLPPVPESTAMSAALRPMSIPLPQPMANMDESTAQHIYVQAMNNTPTNFFEGFSSETAMMDYFSWHEQENGMDAGTSGGAFSFQ